MAQNSKIEWTTHTANLWWGCTEVHAGCDNCYARVLSHRWGHDEWGNDKPRRAIMSVWKDLDRYQREAWKADRFDRVFVGSMMDIFEKPMPLSNPFRHYENTDDLRQEFFTRICAEIYPNLLFLLLTKRPSNIPKYVPAGWLDNPEPNVMYGTSPVDQKTADKLIPQLLKIKGKKFLSVEPQLGHINLRHMDVEKTDDKDWCQIDCLTGEHSDMARPYHPVPKIDWVIQGGESGHNRRPFNLDWARNMRDQCQAAGVPYFFKQIDKIKPIPNDLQVRQFPE